MFPMITASPHYETPGATFSKVPRKIFGNFLSYYYYYYYCTQFPITSLNRIDRSISRMFNSRAISSG